MTMLGGYWNWFGGLAEYKLCFDVPPEYRVRKTPDNPTLRTTPEPTLS